MKVHEKELVNQKVPGLTAVGGLYSVHNSCCHPSALKPCPLDLNGEHLRRYSYQYQEVWKWLIYLRSHIVLYYVPMSETYAVSTSIGARPAGISTSKSRSIGTGAAEASCA